MENSDLPLALFSSELLQFGALANGNRVVHLCVRFFLTRSPTNHLFCEFQFTGADDFSMRRWWGIYAYDVSRFLVELNQLYVSLDGKAELRGQFDTTPRMTVSAVSGERGQLQVSGELFTAAEASDIGSVLEGAVPGIYLAFGGFSADQSYIPSWIESIRALFCEGQVDETAYF